MEERIEVRKIENGEVFFNNSKYDPKNTERFRSDQFQDIIDDLLSKFGAVIDCFLDMSDANLGPASIMESVLRDVSLQFENIVDFLQLTLGKIEFEFSRSNGTSPCIPQPVAITLRPSEYLKKGM